MVAKDERLPDRVKMTVAGLIVCRRRPGTAKAITFLLLEDETDLLNVIVSQALYEAEGRWVRGEACLAIEGQPQKQAGTVILLARRLRPLDDVPTERRGPPGD